MKIKQLRETLGLTQLQLAELIGVSRVKLAQAESKISSLDQKAIDRLKELETQSRTDISIDDLPPEVISLLEKETEKTLRHHSLDLQKKRAELKNVIEKLEKMRFEHEGAKKSLNFFSEEINIFRNVPTRRKRLEKNYKEVLKVCLSSAPCHQQILVSRKESLQKYIAGFS